MLLDGARNASVPDFILRYQDFCLLETKAPCIYSTLTGNAMPPVPVHLDHVLGPVSRSPTTNTAMVNIIAMLRE